MQTKLFLSTLLILEMLCLSISAQSLSTLKSQNKKKMQELKVKYELNSINIEVGDNGFWYYLVTQKKGNQKYYGALNNDGSILFECAYTGIIYINGIYNEGYVDYTFNAMTGGTNVFKLYNHKMPDHFIIQKAETDNTEICSRDGKIIKSGIKGDIKYLGSWLLVNTKKIYTRQLDGALRLMLVNNEEKNMGLMTWDGNQIFDNETFLMYISNKVSGKYNNVYAFNSKNRAGAVYLENLNSIVPIEYSEIRAIFGQMKFEVKLNPTDAYHIYNKELKEKFIPKNPGEKFFVEYKYEDCIKYYATSGVLDADSKLYSASALYAIAITRIIELKNHVAVPSANKLNNYNYNEIKGILNDAKTILKSAMYQDSLRTKVYQDIINNCDTQLGQLETYNAQLKENSFGNQILKSILAGISEGLKQAALNSINSSIVNTNGKSQTTSNNNRPSHSSGPNSSGTTSSSNNNNGGLSDGVQARIRQVERNIVNETEYLQKAQERYKNNPTGAAKSAVEAHKRAIEGYRKQIEELKRGN